MERYGVKLDDSSVSMKQKVIPVVDPILSFLQEFEKTKSSQHDGLDDGCPTQRYASCLFSFIGNEHGIGCVNEYDGKSVCAMSLESDQHLHLACDDPIKHSES